MKKAFIALISISFALAVKGQVVPLSSQYYQNPYLMNPAMAGINGNVRVNLAYRSQWNGIKGGPGTQAITAELGADQKRTGVGIHIYNDKAGLITQTRAMASLAYHLPLNGQSKLHFGFSLGMLRQRLNEQEIEGSAGDPAIAQFNDRSAYLDGDFGAAYSNGRFKAELALPYLKELVQSDKANAFNRTKYYTSVSYQLINDSQTRGFGVQPMVAVRGTNYTDGLTDIGANVTFAQNKANITGIYHSQGSVSLGMGMQYKEVFGLQFNYNTGTSALRDYSNGDFELSLRLDLK